MFPRFKSITLIAVVMVLALAANAIAFAQDAEERAPEAVVEAFYSEYLSYFYASETEPTFPPEGWYHESGLLTADFVAALDAFEDRYDPLLCAQNIPTAFLVEDAELSAEEDAARVVVRTDFANFHAFEIELVQDEDAWLIDGVTCQEVEQDPAGVVKQFYLIFLSYNAWDGEGERANFFVDGTYSVIPLVSEAFAAELDELKQSGELGYDPLICAQDVPESVEVVEVEIEEGAAVVTVESSFEGHGFAVELEQVEDVWIITGITCGVE